MRQSRQRINPPPIILSERFIKIVFLLLGVGILLPWNAYISAKQYFVSRLCNETEDGGKYHNIGQTIEMWFSIVYNGAGVLSLAVVILVQHLAESNNNNITSTATPTNQAITKSTKGILKSVRSMIFKSTTNLSVSMTSSKVSSANTIDTRHSREYIWYMVMVPLAVYLVVFAVTTLLVFFTSIPPQIFLFLTLSGLFICGVCTAVASSGIVGTAGLFPANLGVIPFFNGQAAGGLLVACANLIASVLDGSAHFILQYCTQKSSSETSTTNTNILFDDVNEAIDEETICIPYEEISLATAGYFSMSGIILVACMVGYNYIDRYKRLVRNNRFGVGDKNTPYSAVDIDIDIDIDTDDDYDNNDDGINNNPCQLLIGGSLPDSKGSPLDQRRSDASSNIKIISTKIPTSYQNITDSKEFRRQNSTDTDTTENTQSVTVSVWLSVQGTALSLFFTYFCTLAIFPVWTSELISAFQCNASSRIRNDLFVPLSFVIFNGGDLVGRYISSAIKFERVINLSRKLVWASIARMFFFFFLFLFCEARRNRYKDWTAIDNDLYSWSIQFLFAVTNGILTNIAFCYAPSLVENRTHPQQVASAILNFALTFGLTVGSFVSGPFLKFASGTW